MEQKLYRESWASFSKEAIQNTIKIRELNDALRKGPPRRGDVVVCVGALSASPFELQHLVLTAAQGFDSFTEDNDPYGEHDFGMFEVMGSRFAFKIAYYDRDLEFGSDEPWNTAVTRRVMTLMYAEDL